MTNLFILLIRAFSLIALFILTLMLITKDTVLHCKRLLTQAKKNFARKNQADPLASLKKAGLSI